ncbi:uncharacterized protein LOC144115466 [Amblyomma americanum]
MEFHKVWRCQHSHRNKPVSQRNLGCPAKLDIKIKKVNQNTKRNDPFLRRETPLPAVIKLSYRHNHSTESADALRLLHPSPETKAEFLAYFEAGMSPCDAIRHQEWIDVHTTTKDDYWAVVIATPIMRRIQAMGSAQNIFFVDSTASCDTTKTTITVLLAPTKAGAVPIAVLLHSAQNTEGYSQAFSLLKQHYPSCFGNRKAPAVFMTDNSRPEKDALQATWPSAHQLLCHFHVLQAEWRWLTSTPSNVPKDKRQQFMAAFQKVWKFCTISKDELKAAKEALVTTCHEGYIKRVFKVLDQEEHCWAGSQGAFCKHQAVVQKAFGGLFPNSPQLTTADCILLAQLALGDRCPPQAFFAPLQTAQQVEMPPPPLNAADDHNYSQKNPSVHIQ